MRLVPALTLPGFPSIFPTTFSTAPASLSVIVGSRLCAVVLGSAFFLFATPSSVARGALAIGAFRVLVEARLRPGSVETVARVLGLELPVVPRVTAILDCAVVEVVL